MTVTVFEDEEAEDCEALDGKKPCREPGIVEVSVFRRLVLGNWMERSNSLCPKHARELRDELVREVKD